MRKHIIFICMIFILLTACSKSSADNAKPESLYKQDNSMDFLVYNGTAYVNASEIDWAKELELTADEKLGEIKRTDVTKKFKDYDATILEVGTQVYSVMDRDDFVLVLVGGEYIPYYAYVEG